MASCSVPDLSAVVVALAHLKELGKELNEQEVPFAAEACLHLTEITAAITKLERDRRAAHEHLEVKTIENSKLRHQINSIRERMREEIMTDVAAARASNAEEIERLQKDLSAISQSQEATVKRQETVLSKNEALYPEREQVKSEHAAIVAFLNDQITLKYRLQMQLDETLAQIEELKSCIAAAEQNKITQKQKIALEREDFNMIKDNLSGEMLKTKDDIQQQKQVIKIIRTELEKVNNKKQEISNHLGELMIDMAKQENNMKRSTDCRHQFEKQLKEETQRHQDLRQQGEIVKKLLCEIEEAFNFAIQHVKKEIATVECKMEEGRASRLPLIKVLAQRTELFKRQHDEENKVRTKHSHVSQQLLCSKLQLEKYIASVVKHSHEIREMDKQMRELLEADVFNKQVFNSNQEELCCKLDAEKKNVRYLEEEKSRQSRLLEEMKMKQQEHMAKITSDIASTRRRYEELQQEEAALHQRHPESVDTDLLMRHVAESEVMYRQMEIDQHQEIEQCISEMEIIMRSNKEKQREVEDKEEILKEMEARMHEEQTRNQRLTVLTSQLSSRRYELNLSIQGLKEETSALLQPKEKMKAELEALRGNQIDVLNKQTSELRAVEISIYDNRVKLEQVSMENSRMHLSIRQMTEDVTRAKQNRDRYWQEAHKFDDDIRAVFESLQKAWGEELLITQDCQRSNGVLLMSMSALLNHLKTRRQQLGNVNSILHQQMLEFSKRLGDKTTVAQHS